MKRIYLDTNVLVTYVRKEPYRGLKSSSILKKLLSCSRQGMVKLYTSSLLLDEVSSCCRNLIKDVRRVIRDNGIILVPYTVEDRKRAKEIDTANFKDALHALVATKLGVDLLITNNVSDFLYGGIKSLLREKNVEVQDIIYIYAFCR